MSQNDCEVSSIHLLAKYSQLPLIFAEDGLIRLKIGFGPFEESLLRFSPI